MLASLDDLQSVMRSAAEPPTASQKDILGRQAAPPNRRFHPNKGNRTLAEGCATVGKQKHNEIWRYEGVEHYEIHIRGHLVASWSDWFDGLTVTNLAGGEALISGALPDQAALYGILARVASLNLALLGVRRVAPGCDEPPGRQ